MLVEAGRRISTTLGEQTLVARLGGDEFAVLVEGVSDHVVAEALAATLLEELGKPLWVAGRELFPSASRSEEHTSELQSLMRTAYAVFCLRTKRQYQQP